MHTSRTFIPIVVLAAAAGCGLGVLAPDEGGARTCGAPRLLPHDAPVNDLASLPVSAALPYSASGADVLAGYGRPGPPIAPGFRRVQGLVVARRVSTCGASTDLPGLKLATGDGVAIDFGDAQCQGSVRVTEHDLLPGPGHAHATSVRLGIRASGAPAPSGPFGFAGFGFSMDWVYSDEFDTLQPLMVDDDSDPIPLGAYLEAGAGIIAGHVILVAQFSASASFLYYEEYYLDYYRTRSVGFSTWALSFGVGSTF